MKQFAILTVVAMTLALSACGGGNTSGNIDGNWTATLTDTNNNPVFGFTTSLSGTGNGGSFKVNNFTFTTSNSSCFGSGDTETGQFALSGNFNGNVTGSYSMTIQSGNPSGNQLVLTGTVNGGTITGTWVLTGTSSGCLSGNGNFTMTKS